MDITVYPSTGDDAPAIQAAVTAGQAAGGGTIHLPAAAYNIASQILITASDVIINGGGLNVTKVFMTASGGSAFKFQGTFGASLGNCGIANMEFGKKRRRERDSVSISTILQYFVPSTCKFPASS